MAAESGCLLTFGNRLFQAETIRKRADFPGTGNDCTSSAQIPSSESHSRIADSWSLPFRRRPSRITAEEATLRFRSCAVLPNPLPPEVANRMMVFPAKSWLSRNVLIIVGAVYHQIGKPSSTVSYSWRFTGWSARAGREFLSRISRELREFLSRQLRSAAV